MGYLDIALKVVGEDLKDKEGQNQKDHPNIFPETNCEKSEISEIRGVLINEIRMKPKPYLDTEGDLVIPYNSDPQYHWWNGGQTVSETVLELSQGPHN